MLICTQPPSPFHYPPALPQLLSISVETGQGVSNSDETFRTLIKSHIDRISNLEHQLPSFQKRHLFPRQVFLTFAWNPRLRTTFDFGQTMVPRQAIRVAVAIDTGREMGADASLSGKGALAKRTFKFQPDRGAGLHKWCLNYLGWKMLGRDDDSVDGIEPVVKGSLTFGIF